MTSLVEPGPSSPAVQSVDQAAPVGPRERFAHIRALDGLRGVAVVLVVLSHFATGLAPGGFLGVDLFFVLSGFLITSLLVSEWETRSQISLPRFWARRARRLFPALLVVVAAVMLYSVIWSSRATTHRVGLDGLAALFYVANWRFILSGQSYIEQFLQTAPSPLRHTWSLAIEEQFYVVWPLVVLAVTRVAIRRSAGRPVPARRMRHLLAGVAAVAGVASFSWMLVLHSRGASLDRLYYGTDTRVFMILAGAVLGALTAGRPFAGRSWRVVLIGLGSVGLAALLVATVWINVGLEWLYAGGYGAIAIVLVVVLAAAAQPGTNPLGRLLEVRAFVGLGLISYGVYLWHWPIVLWVTPSNTHLDGFALFVVRCALTLGVSLLSYRFVEQPIRHGWLPHLGPVTSRLATPAIVLAVVICVLVPIMAFPAVDAAPRGPPPGRAAAVVTTEYSRSPRCDGPKGAGSATPGSKLLIQVEGNSILREVYPCLGTTMSSRGVALETVTDPKGFLICRDVAPIEAQAARTHPDAAILFLFVAYDNRCGDPWHRPIDQLVAFWKAHGTHVYLIPSVPIVKGGRDDLAPGPLLEASYYASLAAADPSHVTVLDGGKFLRDSAGQYLWRMPCLPGGEPGCDSTDTVGVRFVDGLHFCTDPGYAAHGCIGAEHQAGERRAAASIASGLIPSLQAVFGARGPATSGPAPPTTAHG